MTTQSLPPPLYRWSVLGTALVRMWRGWRIVVPVVVGNAVIQALLLIVQPRPYLTLGFVALALVSFIVFALSFGALVAAMLQASDGKVSTSEALARVRSRLLPLLAWMLAWALVMTLGFAVYVVPGLILLAVTPCLLIAVVDGQRNPLVVNFRVIAARWGRWLVTVGAVGVVVVILWLLGMVDGFFVGGPLGALIGWPVLGLFSAWFTCAWVLIYRSCIRAGIDTA